MILSAQSIRARCDGDRPMLSPFTATKRVVNGKSAGLSGSSYDLCIDHDLTLGVHPGYVLGRHFSGYGATAGFRLRRLRRELRREPLPYSLAYTVEDLDLPADVCCFVIDKSSYARNFISAMNTLGDAGFRGNLTLELVNFAARPLSYRRGDPVCQLVFHRLDQATELPYAGKYQHQTKAAHPARHERADGSFTVQV